MANEKWKAWNNMWAKKNEVMKMRNENDNDEENSNEMKWIMNERKYENNEW